MSDSRTFVIVGAGLAGAKAAEALRDEGFDGRIMLIGAEAHRPYERPPLSKGYLQGNAEPRDGLRPPAGAGTPSTTSTCGSAPRSPRSTAERPRARRPTASRLRYDKLLLATGATPRRLTVPGADLDGVHYLRTPRGQRAPQGRAPRRRAGW